jgi:hypothetical protein
MKNVVYWGIQTQFVPHKKHIMSPLQSLPVNSVQDWDFHGDDDKKCRLLWYKTKSVVHKKNITSPLWSYERFEVFTAVTMKNVVFWGLMPCGSCENRCFWGTYRLHHQGDKNQRAKNSVVAPYCYRYFTIYIRWVIMTTIYINILFSKRCKHFVTASVV